jgi:hypothetical protein
VSIRYWMTPRKEESAGKKSKKEILCEGRRN